MAADVKLLPLPEWVPDPIIGHLLNDVDREFCEQYAISYARASVEAATEALRKRCEAVEADAARYRWLRHKLTCGHFATDEEVAFLDAKDDASLDTAIDQAIAAAQEPSHG